jgi:hypothetical protein
VKICEFCFLRILVYIRKYFSAVSLKSANKVRHLSRDSSDIFKCLFPTARRSFTPINIVLASICPCIASISMKYNQKDATFSRCICFYKLLYKFQAVPLPIIRSTKLYIQRQVLSNQYCCSVNRYVVKTILLQQAAVLF